ncbi:MAG: type II secretion system F family protein [bacterium]|jgi:tight adherence protein C
MVNMEWIIIWALSFATIALLLRGIIPQGSEKAVDRLIKKQIEAKRQETQIRTSIQAQKPFKKLGNFLEKHFGKNQNNDKSSYNETQKLLSEAGYREGYSVYLYNLSQLIGVIVGLILGAIFAFFNPLEGTLAMLPYIVGPAIGVYIPILYVKNKRNRRVSEIKRIFPDALEMLALCNEASMTVDMALPKLAKEMEKKYPVLSEELFIISIELSLLDSRAKAFEGFYKRFPLDEVRSFVTTINQAERTGTPIAKSMRLIATEMRKDRIASIQAKLEALASKLVLPLILFLFVPVILFMFLPIFSGVGDKLDSF